MSKNTIYNQRLCVRRQAFAAGLNRRMELTGVTQRELADMTGIAADQLSRYCNEKTMPGARHQEKIAKALKCNRSDLFIRVDQGLPSGEFLHFKGDGSSTVEGRVTLELRKSVSIEQATHIMQILGGNSELTA